MTSAGFFRFAPPLEVYAMYRTPAAAYTNAGRCARADGRPADAESYFRKALAYQPDQPDAVQLRPPARVERFEHAPHADTAICLLHDASLACHDPQFRDPLIPQRPARDWRF